MIWISTDPGGEHVGMAFWEDDRLVDCDEYDPLAAMLILDSWEPATLVIEEFRLYPSKAKTLTGSTMETAQLIGAMTWWAFQHNAFVYMQPAAIKTPTLAYARKHEIQLTTDKGGHAKDAHTHGIHYLIRSQGRPTPGSDLFGGGNLQ
ncbi:RuvC-like resolvase [Gordonia phage Archimedes]|uniref:RuvC-like resolvase n=1 Tax=Gordonia phage Archimedes TaxID=2759389 RepID=A0A7L7STC1_9CAUD|nr:RuvC-like resolvase [Gordonia phage Archimedes]QOC55735.1 RuvC-like resolvase [Gordonia phage Archimedes]